MLGIVGGSGRRHHGRGSWVRMRSLVLACRGLQQRYRLLARCFAHGFMDGEALEMDGVSSEHIFIFYFGGGMDGELGVFKTLLKA